MISASTKMQILKIADFEKVIFFDNTKMKVQGIIAIHNSKLGPALGGCRINSYSTFLSGLNDCLSLARSMTYKNALMDLPYGGGKTVIFYEPEIVREHYFEVLAEVLNELDGSYLTTDDLGSSLHDMYYLKKYTPYVRGKLLEQSQIPATSYGVFQAIKAALYFNEKIKTFDGIKVIVQGLGKVGYPLCRFLHSVGFQLYVDDHKKELVEKAAEEFNAIPINISNASKIKAAIFSPCAVGGVIDKDMINRLHVQYIIGGSNNPLSNPQFSDLLHNKGIIYLPDYLCNAGGVIDIFCEEICYSEEYVLERVAAIYQKTFEILNVAMKRNTTPSRVADHYVKSTLTTPPRMRSTDVNKVYSNLCKAAYY